MDECCTKIERLLKHVKLRTLFVCRLCVSGMFAFCMTSTAFGDEVKISRYLGYLEMGSKSKFTPSSTSCAQLQTVKLSEDGHLNWYFSTTCKTKIYNLETYPPKNIRGVSGLSSSKEEIPLGTFFKIKTTPDVYAMLFTLNDHIGRTRKRGINVSGPLKMLREIAASGDWISNFTASESQLKETKAADKTPPSIRILSPIAASGQVPRVDTYTSFVRGQVSDNQGVMNILVNGKKVGIKEDGSFAAKIKLGVGRNDVLVQAEDINNNVAETKLTIIREEFISEQTLVDVDMPPKTRMNNPDALAVVIGVESYQYVPDAAYAYNDAEVFREYLAETMGMKRQRIKLATNSKATQAEFSKLLGPNGWLARNITKGKSDVVVYFSGHGIASPDAKSSGLLPHDVDPNYSVGLQTTQVYQDLAAMGAKSVTVFLDACFTGQTRNSEMLIANARPIVIKPLAAAVPGNITVISAASGSQISGALEEKEHGLFTYYLLKGLGGDADSNKDKSINISELKSFVSAKVKEQAALNGREQTPEIQGSSNNVLVRFQ